MKKPCSYKKVKEHLKDDMKTFDKEKADDKKLIIVLKKKPKNKRK